MPIFEYCCKACCHEFEEIRPGSEADKPTECPKCGKKKSERMLSSFATSKGAAAGAGSATPTGTGTGAGCPHSQSGGGG